MENLSPEQMQAHMEKWKTWMGGLAEQGKLAGGLPLAKEGKQVINSGNTITDGPFAEGKEVVGGYLIINAEDIDSATEISKDCPLLESSNANIEVREILSM